MNNIVARGRRVRGSGSYQITQVVSFSF